MCVSYDLITQAFLSKVMEFEFIKLPEENLTETVDGYMKRAAVAFTKVCKYDLTKADDVAREFYDDFDEADVDEIVDILSDGMLVQWLKPYLYKQELLEDNLNAEVCSVSK